MKNSIVLLEEVNVGKEIMKFIKLAYVYSELFNRVIKYELEEGNDKELKTALVFFEGVMNQIKTLVRASSSSSIISSILVVLLVVMV